MPSRKEQLEKTIVLTTELNIAIAAFDMMVADRRRNQRYMIRHGTQGIRDSLRNFKVVEATPTNDSAKGDK